MNKVFLAIFVPILLLANAALAQSGNYLADRNGDGVLSVACFGDSITYGVGDGTNPGEFVEFSPITDGKQGYPRRMQDWAGILTKNFGRPSERLVGDGLVRLPSILATANTDILVIFEGANDSFLRVSSEIFARAVQKSVNMARAKGYMPLLTTIPTPCCNRGGRGLFTREYSGIIRDRAAINDVPLADVELAWRTTCNNKERCELFNIPDGIHPNKRGYDVIAQTMLAAIYGIDIFSPNGARQLEEALGFSPGTVIVKPRSSETTGVVQ